MSIYQTFKTLENVDRMDSGLSFSEHVIHASYLTEKIIGKRKLKLPSFYKERIFEIKNNLKQDMEKRRKTSEEAIKYYINSLYQKGFDSNIFPTEALEADKTNCVSSAAIFLSLAEMLDYSLFEKCCVGYISGKEEKNGHVFVRKETGKEYENIDHGETFPDSSYMSKYGKLPITKARESIIARILNIGGVFLARNEEEAIKLFDDAIKTDTESGDALSNKGNTLCILGKFEEGIKCFDEALKIEPKNIIAQENKKSALECLKHI